MNSKLNKKKAVTVPNPSLEETRQTVIELELKARYWEAMWKIRFYTLESDKLNDEYEKHVTALKEVQAQAFAQLKADIEAAQEKTAEGQEVLDSQLTAEPELKEEVVNG